MPIYSTDRIWPGAQQVRAGCRSGLYRLAKIAVLFALRFRVLPQAATPKALLRTTFDARWPQRKPQTSRRRFDREEPHPLGSVYAKRAEYRITLPKFQEAMQTFLNPVFSIKAVISSGEGNFATEPGRYA